MLRTIGIIVAVLSATTVQAKNYGYGYCKSCYVAPVVQKVIAQPYNTTNIGNLNQFYTPAPYAQQYPVTDAAYTAAVAEQIQYNLQSVNDQVAQLRAQSQQRLVLVVPQVQAYAVQQETVTTSQGYCAPGMQPQQPQQPTTFSQTAPLIDKCAACHGEGKKAQKHFDMSRALDCDQQKSALLAFATGRMPKGAKQLPSEDQLQQLSDELGKWNPNPPQQPTPPQDQPSPAPSPNNGENAAPQEPPFSRIQLPPTPGMSAAKFVRNK